MSDGQRARMSGRGGPRTSPGARSREVKAEPPTVVGLMTRGSPFALDQTLDRLLATIRTQGLQLFAHIDHAANAAAVGLRMPPAHVLLFGSPRAGTSLMLASPLLALDLPLRVLVWQDGAEQTWVSYHDPQELAARYAVPASLAPILASLESLVTAALRPSRP